MEEYRTLNLADIGHTSQTPDSNTKEISPKPKTQKLPIKQKKTKQEKQKKKQRNWTKDEVDCFARVLVEYSFVQQLEQRALKKKANLKCAPRETLKHQINLRLYCMKPHGPNDTESIRVGGEAQ